MRADNLRCLERVLPREGFVLEIGAGTGEEAEALVRAGRSVVALEPSAGMRVRLDARAARLGARNAPPGAGVLRVLPFAAEDLSTSRFDEAPFSAAYASLGPLNCVADLATFARDLAAQLRPGAPFVASIMSRDCLSESWHFLLRGRFRSAFRRRGRGPREVRTHAGDGAVISTWYRTPAEVRRAFAPHFAGMVLQPFPLFLPAPSVMAGRRAGPLFRALTKFEPRVQPLGRLAGLGDHFRLITFRK